MSRLQYPRHLGDRGRAFWKEIAGRFTLRPDEERILEDACREIDIIDRLEEELRDADLTVRGSMGQTVASPLLQELRQHRMVLSRLLTSLKLPDTDAPAQSRSSSAREAAISKWGRRGA